MSLKDITDRGVERGVSAGVALAAKFTPQSFADALTRGHEKFIEDAVALAAATALLVMTCKEMESAGVYAPGQLAKIQEMMGEVFELTKKEVGL